MQELFSGEEVLYINKWMESFPGLKVGITTRNGGTSKGYFATNNFGLHVKDSHEDVITNRKKLAEQLNIPLGQWVSGQQVHDILVHKVSTSDAGRGATSVESSLPGIDGLLTNETGILCTAFFADCVPLFFFDPVTKNIAIAHAGWKGTVGRIAEVMVRKFIDLGTDVKDLLVGIGPCITKEYYEVDEFVSQQVPDEYREKVLTPVGKGHYLLDLKQLNVEILVQAGVFHSNIEVTKFCTFRDEALFYSHRRDNGKTGRMLGFIGFNC